MADYKEQLNHKLNQTVLCDNSLLQDSEDSKGSARENVTSKGETTKAALIDRKKNNFKKAFVMKLKVAAKDTKQRISKEFK